MPLQLKYNIGGQVVYFPGMVSSTDGNTEQTGLSITSMDIKILKAGATSMTHKFSGGATHTSLGVYCMTLSAQDVDTYGLIELYTHPTGTLLSRIQAMVMEPDAYDALYAAKGIGSIETDVVKLGGVAQSAIDLKGFADAGYDPVTNKVQGVVLCDSNTDMRGTNAASTFDPVTQTVDVGKISGSTLAADNLKASASVIVAAAAVAGSLSTVEMTTDLTESTNDHYNGRIIIWTSGVLKGQATEITGYIGGTGKLVYTATTEAPGVGDFFVVV